MVSCHQTLRHTIAFYYHTLATHKYLIFGSVLKPIVTSQEDIRMRRPSHPRCPFCCTSYKNKKPPRWTDAGHLTERIRVQAEIFAARQPGRMMNLCDLADTICTQDDGDATRGVSAQVVMKMVDFDHQKQATPVQDKTPSARAVIETVGGLFPAQAAKAAMATKATMRPADKTKAAGHVHMR